MIRIQKGDLAARDKRMGVLTEPIGAVCIFLFNIAISYHDRINSIKFFAWEERWINRTMDSREAEMKWIIKGKVNFERCRL